jgi:hypothetical protein
MSASFRRAFNTVYDECCPAENHDEIWITTAGIPEARYDLDIYVVKDGKATNIGPPVNTRGGAPGFHESNPHVFEDEIYFEADHGYPGTDYIEGGGSFFGRRRDRLLRGRVATYRKLPHFS